MKIKPSQYARALYEAVLENPDKLKIICQNFFILLKQKGQLKILSQILRELEAVHEKENNEEKFELISARPMTDSVSKKIIGDLEEIINSKIKAEQKIDKDIIGGLKIKGRNILIDGSVSKILQNLKSI